MMTSFRLKHKVASNISRFLPEASKGGHRVLMYHSIYNASQGFSEDNFSTSESMFLAHMDYLASLDGLNIINIESRELLPNKLNLSITFDDGFLDNLTIASKYLEEKKFPYTVFVATGLLGKENFMTIQDLKELSKMKYAHIGSHAHSHIPLCSLNYEESKEELSLSKKILEDVTERLVKTISFPHGSFDQKILDMTYEVGYEKVFSSITGVNKFDINGPYKRTQIFKLDSLEDFKRKIDGKWDWLSKISKKSKFELEQKKNG